MALATTNRGRALRTTVFINFNALRKNHGRAVKCGDGPETKKAHRSEPLLSWNPTYLLVAEARFELTTLVMSQL